MTATPESILKKYWGFHAFREKQLEIIRQSLNGKDVLALLTEEVGEVARIIARRYGEQSEKESDRNKDLGDEMADVLFVLLCLANQTGIDLTTALEKNLEKKNERDESGIVRIRNLDNIKVSFSNYL